MCCLLLPETLHSTWLIFCCSLLGSQEKKEFSLNLLPQPWDGDPSLSGLPSPVPQGRCSWCYQTVSTWVSAWAVHPQEQAACLRGRLPGKKQLFTQLVRNEHYLRPLQLTASSALRFGDNRLCWVTWLLDSGCLRSLGCLGLRSNPSTGPWVRMKSLCIQTRVWISTSPVQEPHHHRQDGLTGFHGPVFPHGW